MAVLWLYVKVFLGFTIPYGTLMSPFWAITAVRRGVFTAIWPILAGGAVFSLTMGTCHLIGVKKAAGRIDRDSLKTRHRRIMKVQLTHENGLEACRGALAEIFKIKDSVPVESGFEVETRLNWRTWGDRVTVTVSADGNSSIIEIRSEPRLFTTLVDYGRNLAIVEAFARWMQEHHGGICVA